MQRAFFPGGNGLFHGSNGCLPVNGTVVLGSNLGSLADYLNADGTLKRQDETQTSPTWRGLYRMLRPRTGIQLEQCFFTNAWPFLHQGNSNETKGLISAWLVDRTLMNKCLNFFERSVSVIRPKLVVALGTGAPAFLSHLWPDKLRAWRANSIAAIDRLPIEVIDFEGRHVVCTAITHPSHSNSWQRRPPFNGVQGEIDIVHQAAVRAGISG